MIPSVSIRAAACAALALLFLATTANATAPPAGPGPLAGTWIFESAMVKGQCQLSRVWTSTLTVTGDRFVLSRPMLLPFDFVGKIILDPADPKKIDLAIEEHDLFKIGVPLKIPAYTIHGIYNRVGNRVTLLLPYPTDGPRPTGFDSAGDDYFRFTFVEAPAGFKKFPDQVKIKVAGTDGKPAAGVTVATFQSWDAKGDKTSKEGGWKYSNPVKTGADGTVTVKYERLRSTPILVHDPLSRQMAIASVPPPGLLKGEVSLVLKPECNLKATLVCEELKKIGKSLGWTNLYVMVEGRRISAFEPVEGKIGLLLPPGKYTLNIYGMNVADRDITITVPEGKAELTLDPISLPAAKLALLEGKPAPELRDVIAWKGQQVKLADLQGKYVLLEFWGHWCGPCVKAMPTLIELHEKFHNRGLVIVGVHVDAEGDVDSAAKLETRIAGYRKKYWGDKDLPFASALIRRTMANGTGSLSGTLADYGIQSYPMTVLIDPQGKVVGEFTARDTKEAIKMIEKLLSKKPSR